MKFWHVARREYVEQVRKKSFIIGTILFPVIMSSFIVIPVLLALFNPEKQLQVTVLDQTGTVAPVLADSLAGELLDDGRPQFVISMARAAASENAVRQELLASVRSEDIDVLLDIPADVFDEGEVSYITKSSRSLRVLELFEDHLSEIVLRQRLEGEGLDFDKVRNLVSGVNLEVREVTKGGELGESDFLSDYMLMFLFVMTLYGVLISWGVVIQRGILDEKQSRIAEVLLSVSEPRDLFMGKLLGIGGAGLTQIMIWAAMGVLMALYGLSSGASFIANINLSPATIGYFVLYFVSGFLLYASMFSVIGAAYNTEQEAQQMQGIVNMILIIPMLSLMLIVQSPNAAISAVLSLIPLFTPMLMMARTVVVDVPAWQILLSVVIMATSIFMSVSFAARVFRIGVLMYGKKPSIREIARWYRMAGKA